MIKTLLITPDVQRAKQVLVENSTKSEAFFRGLVRVLKWSLWAACHLPPVNREEPNGHSP